ncbi:3D domain-containing protein [Desulfosporosinus sp. PR]|uniref:G5 and 3D domain-containing protein n=1 Tax=Candidatus Desulfosporosinus nitrosoreducens TaxID=3401928 RepID=UPI0027F1D577|nr:3D domain-containing protein [Desulfosporosinus sp. PR]MDQ7092769.1 3D domain-containing protein [Desulfosporosinus sp. PR]
MYSLPITTYSDYWRATKTWSSYLGGLAVFAAGTRYTALSTPDVTQISQVSYQQFKQPQNVPKPKLEISFLDSRKTIPRVGNISRGASYLNEGSLKAPSLDQDSREVPGDSDSNPVTDNTEKTKQLNASQEQNQSDALTQEELGEGANSTAIQSSGTAMTNVTEIVDKEIPFDTQVIETDKLLPGMTQVQEEGENGVLRQFVKTFEVGGQPVDQQVQLSFELKSPKKKVVIQNSKPVVGEHFDLDKLNVSKTITVESTAYTYTGNKTAVGLPPRQGLIAVDPRVIAMGSKVYVEGYGYAIAADTGGDIRGNRIDVFFSTLRQCLDWGRKPVRIHVLKPI